MEYLSITNILIGLAIIYGLSIVFKAFKFIFKIAIGLAVLYFMSGNF